MADGTLPANVTALTADIAANLRGTVLGREDTGGTRETDIATAALIECYCYAPSAPLPVLQEAATRLGGWQLGNRPHGTSFKVQDPSMSILEVEQPGAATANGLRASGASAMLSRFVRRRAGAIK